MNNKFFKHSLICTAVATSLILSQQAFAEQETTLKEKDVERISVTGSRIARIHTDTPSPVVSLDHQSIKNTGFMNVNDLLTKMPQFSLSNDSSTGNYSFGNAGLNTANLRDLGSERTLTIVNGRRIVQSAKDDGILVTDTGFIPIDLLERTDILTGGASSTYGSDAIAGVVNFVLKRDYEGTRVSGQIGESGYNDGKEKSFTLTTGHNFLNDDANIVFSYDYYDQGYAATAKRSGAGSRTDWITNPLHNPDAENVDSDGIPAKIIAHDITWPDYNINGQIIQTKNYDTGFSDYYDITNVGADYLFDSSDIHNSYRLLNPNGFDPAADGKVRSPYERHNLYLLFNYALSDTTQLTTDIRYTGVESQNTTSPEFSYGSWGNSSDFADDVELSQEVWDLLDSDGGWYKAPYTLNDLGPRTSRTDRDLLAISATLEGEFANGWLWDVYVSSGITQTDVLRLNNANDYRRVDNHTYGANGICGVEDMSCPAWNSLQPMNAEVVDYVRLDPFGQQITSEQHLFSTSLSGDLYELPAGDLMFAAGIEGRRESIDVQVDDTWQDEDLSGSQKLPWKKARNIVEAFAEIEVPLVSDVFLINDLTLNTAIRYADYSYSGQNTSWKLALNWSLFEGIALRSTYAHAVRAPQLKEMFGAPSTGFSSGLTDPCDQTNVNSLPADEKSTVIANCQAFGIEDPENFASETNLGNGTDTTTSGNQILEVEKADTLTIGLVYQPSFIDNLALTVDYFDIDLTDSIENTSSSEILYGCAESIDINNSIYCPLVSRKSDGNISNVLKAPVNKGAFTRRGIDFEANYSLESSFGDLNFALYATHTIQVSDQSSPTDEAYNWRGVYDTPDWKGRFVANYSINAVRVNWSVDHTTSTLVKRNATIEDYDRPETPSFTVHNARLAYDLSDSTEIYLGARNIFDKSWTAHPTTSGYNLMGRYYYGGFSYEF
ncbi:TonB-dependent receptor plug domain-containing protein [Colwellia psychrerythraea]|uniref:TonB-dependent receptor n=1 Tax=Colwellia psychrerythraea TaxID=28229 RepID=A0A099KLV1_COLPS|nr:TonB-dependent receptor [Colwellia psychrerythraea]KGJ91205.1 TonB-dependent receptor [Colwellia psychrerythraea]